jgi:hypothetical protein
MALLSCPECGHQVSSSALACPQCGFPIRNTGDVTVAEKPSEIARDLSRYTPTTVSSLILFGLVVIVFLGPFLDFGLVRVTGVELATGRFHSPIAGLTQAFSGTNHDPEPDAHLLTALVAALGGVLASANFSMRTRAEQAGIAILRILAGCVAIYGFLGFYGQFADTQFSRFVTEWLWAGVGLSVIALGSGVTSAGAAVRKAQPWNRSRVVAAGGQAQSPESVSESDAGGRTNTLVGDRAIAIIILAISALAMIWLII